MENKNGKLLIPLCGGLLIVVGMLLNVMHEANAVAITVAAQGAKIDTIQQWDAYSVAKTAAVQGAELEAVQQQIVLLRKALDEKTVSRYKETDAIRNHDLIMERIRALEQHD